jgi:predicted porin
MKTRLMMAAAVGAIFIATGAAHAQSADVSTLKAQADALKKQNELLEQRLNKLEKLAAAQQAVSGVPANSFMAADLPVVKGVISQCALPSPDGPLTFCGITLFGNIDAGLSYASSGLPINGKYYNGDELVNKYAHSSYFGFLPNGISSTGLGLKGSAEFLPGWSGVFMASTYLNPQSGQLQNGPGSMVDNQGLNRNAYSNWGDGSRGGQAFNDQLYVGVASKEFGQLTFGRHRAFTNDLVAAYDPTGGAAAFSAIGYSGTYVSGLGTTANARWDDSFKYKVEFPVQGIGSLRFGAMYKFADGNGGSNVGNASGICTGTNAPAPGCAKSTITATQYYASKNDAGQIDLGGSYGGLDVDGVLGYFHQAIANTPLSAAQLSGISTFTSNTFIGNVAQGTTTYGNANSGLMSSTATDNTGGAIGAKYTWNQFKFYAGWAHAILHNPANNVGIGAQNDQGGYVISSVTNGSLPHARLLDTVWVGVKYAYDPKTDFTVAYDHVNQNSYGFAANTPGVANTASTSLATCSLPRYLPFGGTVVTYGGVKTVYAAQSAPRSSACSGTLDAVSGFVDYHFTKRFDVYAGIMYSVVGGGLASSYYNVNNVAPSVGARFTF